MMADVADPGDATQRCSIAKLLSKKHVSSSNKSSSAASSPLACNTVPEIFANVLQGVALQGGQGAPRLWPCRLLGGVVGWFHVGAVHEEQDRTIGGGCPAITDAGAQRLEEAGLGEPKDGAACLGGVLRSRCMGEGEVACWFGANGGDTTDGVDGCCSRAVAARVTTGRRARRGCWPGEGTTDLDIAPATVADGDIAQAGVGGKFDGALACGDATARPPAYAGDARAVRKAPEEEVAMPAESGAGHRELCSWTDTADVDEDRAPVIVHDG